MWKPTKKQHLTNKKYVDEHGGGSGSGSNDIFIVHCHIGDPADDPNANRSFHVTCDESFDDILAAYNSGMKIVVMTKDKDAGKAGPILTHVTHHPPLDRTHEYFSFNDIVLEDVLGTMMYATRYLLDLFREGDLYISMYDYNFNVTQEPTSSSP